MEQFIYWFIIAEIIGAIVLMFLPLKRDRAYWITLAIGAVLAAVSAISKLSAAAKQRKAANAINPDDPTYVADPNIQANQNLATQLFNGRMAGASDLERNIQGSQANTFGQINRNATNSAQALSLAANTQAQTNNSLQQLQVQEAQSKYGLAQQLYGANQAVANENYKVYADKVRKNNNDVNAKIALQQAAANNRSGAYSDLATSVQAGTAAYGGAQQAGVFGGGNSNIPSASTSTMQSSPYPWMNSSVSNTPALMTNPNIYPNAGQWYFNAVAGKWVKQ